MARKTGRAGETAVEYPELETESTYSVTEFKARCLELIERIQHTREELTITRHGKPVARLVPHEATSEDVFGCMRGTVTILGDVVAPTGAEWTGDADNA